MAKKVRSKKKTKKAATKKPLKKAAKKKALKKKPSKKRTAKKKTLKKKTAKRKSGPKSKPVRKRAVVTKSLMVEPGPAGVAAQPVEEPVQREEAVGTVTHYYSHLNVAVVQLNNGKLRTGSTIHIKGVTTDFTQTVDSMEYEHLPIEQALAGQSFGLRVKEHAREHDIVYLVK